MSDITWTVGQRVALGDSILTVERVTPSGMPVAGGETFRKDGAQRGERRSWRSVWLTPLTPKLEAQINERAAMRAMQPRWINTYKEVEAHMPGWGRDAKITADQLRRICDAIEAILAEPPQ